MDKTVYLPEARSDHIWAVIGAPWTWLAVWLALVNLAAFLAFGLDKRRARRKAVHPNLHRVPERTLFLLAALGGSIGALLGMRVFHHKTLHPSFRWGLPAILAAQLLLALGLYYRFA